MQYALQENEKAIVKTYHCLYYIRYLYILVIGICICICIIQYDI